MAARLHDTVEDNDDIRFEDLESIFGKDVRRNLGQKQKKDSPRGGSLVKMDMLQNSSGFCNLA